MNIKSTWCPSLLKTLEIVLSPWSEGYVEVEMRVIFILKKLKEDDF